MITITQREGKEHDTRTGCTQKTNITATT